MPTPNRIADLRLAAGLSRVALSRDLDVDPATIWRWESGARGISDTNKHKLAERFDVPVAYVMGWDEKAAA